MALLIDTSVFIGLERRGLSHDSITHLAPEQDTALSALTIAELVYGLHRANSESRRASRSAFIERLVRIS